MSKDKLVGSSQPATASIRTLKQTVAEKRAAKRSAESARSSVSEEAIASAKAESEIMALQASAAVWCSVTQTNNRKRENAKEACRIRVSVSQNGNQGNRRTSTCIL